MKKEWIEKIKLYAETITAVLPLAKMLLVITGVLSLVLVVKTNKQQDEMDQYIAMYKQYEADAQQASRYADSLSALVIVAENEARAAISRADYYKKEAAASRVNTSDLQERADSLEETITDTLELARALLPVKDSIIATQQTTIDSQIFQIYNLETSLKNKDMVIHLLNLTQDSLRIAVNNIPSAPTNPNRMFGIKMPSRKTSFIVGAAIGVLATGIVLR